MYKKIIKSKRFLILMLLLLSAIVALVIYFVNINNNTSSNSEEPIEPLIHWVEYPEDQRFEPKIEQNYVQINSNNTPEIAKFFNQEKLIIEMPEDTKMYAVNTASINFARGGTYFFDAEKSFMIHYTRKDGMPLSPLDPESVLNQDDVINEYWYVLQDIVIPDTKVFVYEIRTFDLYNSPSGKSPIIVSCSGVGELEPEIRANCNHIIDNLGVENLPVAESIR